MLPPMMHLSIENTPHKNSINGVLHESTPEVLRANQLLQSDMTELGDFHNLGKDLSKRLRFYDHCQRITFGRAQTIPMLPSEILENLESKNLFKKSVTNDPSAFPSRLSPNDMVGVRLIIAHSIKKLMINLNAGDTSRKWILSIYCHRVAIGPRLKYLGFTHRDAVNPTTQNCGTVLWYPYVSPTKIEGCHLNVWGNHQYLTQKPMLSLRPEQYSQSSVYLPFPHNLRHGVSAAYNPLDAKKNLSTRELFFAHDPSVFIKDLFIVTLSETPTWEN